MPCQNNEPEERTLRLYSDAPLALLSEIFRCIDESQHQSQQSISGSWLAPSFDILKPPQEVPNTSTKPIEKTVEGLSPAEVATRFPKFRGIKPKKNRGRAKRIFYTL
ncbi:hypothetical protein ABW19_dt0202592 [Dactylella cylindrospora]|nr:hypothetical protein ABW19_dt0202592 [Dactylella cylindrospora]